VSEERGGRGEKGKAVFRSVGDVGQCRNIFQQQSEESKRVSERESKREESKRV
jgi:hypothetical protein